MPNPKEPIKALVFDFSRVLIFATDQNYVGDLNPLHRSLLEKDSNYPFLEHFYLNQELLDYLKNTPRHLFIFTSGTIQEAPVIQSEIQKVFQAVYSAEKMGVRKTEPEAYLLLCKKLNLNPEHVLFIDDTQRNIDAAVKAGLQTVLFTSNKELFRTLDRLL